MTKPCYVSNFEFRSLGFGCDLEFKAETKKFVYSIKLGVGGQRRCWILDNRLKL